MKKKGIVTLVIGVMLVISLISLTKRTAQAQADKESAERRYHNTEVEYYIGDKNAGDVVDGMSTPKSVGYLIEHQDEIIEDTTKQDAAREVYSEACHRYNDLDTARIVNRVLLAIYLIALVLILVKTDWIIPKARTRRLQAE